MPLSLFRNRRRVASIQRSRKRALQIESLESRQLLASGVTNLEIYRTTMQEGGSDFPGQITNTTEPGSKASWARTTYTVAIDPTDPTSSVNNKVLVRIAGDSDAFDVSSAVVKDTAQSTSTLFVGYLPTNMATQGTFSFAILAREDADADNEHLSVTLTWQYQVPGPNGQPLPEVFDGLARSASLDILDNDAGLIDTMTITATDNSATEPHNIFYKPEAENKGNMRINVPASWNGGTVTLQLSGSATLAADYTFSVANVFPVGKSVTLTNTGALPSGAIGYSLNIPVGVSFIDFAVTAIGDLNEAEGSESVVLEFAPSFQIFPGIGRNIRTAGSGTVNISDEVESLTLATIAQTVKEYGNNDRGAFAIRPGKSGALLRFNPAASVFFEIIADTRNQSGKKNSAQPGNKVPPATGYTGPEPADYHLELLDGTPVILTIVAGTTGTYLSSNIPANDVNEVLVLAVPYNDTRLEDDETIDATLLSRINNDPRVTHGQTTVTIEEFYQRSRDEQKQQNENCSCSCECPTTIKQSSSDGSVQITSEVAPILVTTQGNNGIAPVMMIGLPMPSDKAIPTSISVAIELLDDDPDSRDKGSGLGSKPMIGTNNLVSFQLVPTTTTPGDVIWFSLQLDLKFLLGANVPTVSKNSIGDMLLNFRLLAHATYAPEATTAERMSGWLGYHNFVMTNEMISNIMVAPVVAAGGGGSGSEGEAPLTAAPGYGPTANRMAGPSGVNLFGVKRAILGTKILVVRDDQDVIDLPTVMVNGLRRVANATRFRGSLVAKTANVVIHADGATNIFIDGFSPYTLSRFVGTNTLVDRWGSKYFFDLSGRMIQSKDPQGNATNFTYDSTDGWVSSMIDPLGNPWVVTKTASSPNSYTLKVTRVLKRSNPTDPTNPVTELTWTGIGEASVLGNSGQLVVTGTDPDGTGPRKSMVETFSYSSGILTSYARAEKDSAPTLSYSFSLGYLPGQSGHGTSTVTRSDGATMSVEIPLFQDYLIEAGYSGTISNDDTGTTPPINTALQLSKAPDITVNPHDQRIASVKDWNGNRTLVRIDRFGRSLDVWDAAQVDAMGLQTKAITDPVVAERLATWSSLAYHYDRAPANQNFWGRILSGFDIGEVTGNLSPDPDLKVASGVLVSNGPGIRQQTTIAYTGDKNVNSTTRPTLNATQNTYAADFDILTSSLNEMGGTLSQAVNSLGLITKREYTVPKSASPGHNPIRPYDVNNDGFVSPIDALQINFYLNTSGSTVAPPGPSYLDVDGDGLVTELDIQEVVAYINSPSIPIVTTNTLASAEYTYSSDPGLPIGTLAQSVTKTGRTAGDLITSYQYVVNNLSPANGNVFKITESINATTQRTTQFDYDAFGRVSKITDPAGRTSFYFYDALDRTVAIVGSDPDGTGPLLAPLMRWDYNSFGDVIATETINSTLDMSVGNSTQLLVTAQVTGYQYDALGRLLSSADQSGSTTWYLYRDGLGNIQRTRTKSTATAAGVVTNDSLISYAAANSVIVNSPIAGTPNSSGETAKYPGVVTTYAYDANSNVLSVTTTDAQVPNSSRVASSIYDRLNRPVELISPNPESGLTLSGTDVRDANGGYRNQIQYDNLSRTVQTINGLGNTWAFEYDVLNRTTKETAPDLSTMNYAYSLANAQWGVTRTDSLGRSTTVRQDSLGRTTSISGDTPSAAYFYWADGLVKSSLDANSFTTSYDYNRVGELTQVKKPNALSNVQGSVGAVESFTYTIDGLLASSTDEMLRVTTYSYDAGGRRIRTTAPDPDGSGPLAAGYAFVQLDSLGNVMRSGTALNDPSVVPFNASFQPSRLVRDSQFRVISAFDERGSETSLTYDNFGNTLSVVDPNSNRTTYAYNKLNQLTAETQVLSNVTPNQLLTRSYSYDGLGNVRSQIDRNNRETKFEYDAMGRAISESWYTGTTLNKSLGYSFDSVGNLLGITDSNNANQSWATNFQFAYDRRDQLVLERQSLGALGTSIVLRNTYDNRGVRTSYSANFGGTITPSSNVATGTSAPIVGGVNDFITTITTDALGRQTSIAQSSQSGGNAVDAKRVEFTYDASGMLQTARRYKSAAAQPNRTDLTVQSNYFYDAAGRITSITNTRGETQSATTTWSGLLSTNSASTSVTIANPSFEATALAENASTSTITGWQITGAGSASIYNPTATQYDGAQASQGNNSLALQNGVTIKQVLNQELAANQVYQLAIDVGNRKDLTDANMFFIVELYAGSQFLTAVHQANLSTTNGGYVTGLATYISPNFVPAGQQLEIRISAAATQVNFDNVRLNVAPVAPSAWTGNANQLPTGLTLSNTVSAYAMTYDQANRMTSRADYSGQLVTQTATTIPLQNPSFEATPLGEGVSTATVSGWTFTGTGTAVVYNPTSTQYNGQHTSEGSNALALANGTTLKQITTVDYAANQVYQLSIDVGNPKDITNTNMFFIVELYAGTTQLGAIHQANLSTIDGGYVTGTTIFVSPASVPANQKLEVRVSAAVTQVNFDNVRLTVSPNRNGTYVDTQRSSFNYLGTDELTTSTLTENVAVQNPSFEATALPNGISTPALSDWQLAVGSARIYNPTSTQYTTTEATHGSNVLEIGGGTTIKQLTNIDLAPNRQYTLNVDVGNRMDVADANMFFIIELYAGSQFIGAIHQNNLATVNGGFVTGTATYTSPASVAAQQKLEIRISAAATLVNFDNVRLSSTVVDEQYAYDSNGNRLSTTGSRQSALGSHNRLQTDGTYNYVYDNEGNIIRRTQISDGSVLEYQWDHRNRLTKISTKATGATVSSRDIFYYYDAFDRRIGKTIDYKGNGTIDRSWVYVFDGQNTVMVLQDADGAGSMQGYRISERIMQGPAVDMVMSEEIYSGATGPLVGSSIASSNSGATLWTIGDDQGSIQDAVDNNGVVRRRVNYSAFGQRTNQTDTDANGQVLPTNSTTALDTLFGYTGRDWDSDAQLQNNRARWYDPTTARWLSQDPIGFAAGDANLYRYVGNASTNATDPSGLHYKVVKAPKNPSLPVSDDNPIKEWNEEEYKNWWKRHNAEIAEQATVESAVPSMRAMTSDEAMLFRARFKYENRLATPGLTDFGADQAYIDYLRETGQYDFTYDMLRPGGGFDKVAAIAAAFGGGCGPLGPNPMSYRPTTFRPRPAAKGPLNPVAPKEIPPLVYREGKPSPSNLTPRPQDEGMLSFRDSLSNPITPGTPGPLGGNRPVLRPGEPYMAIDTSKLPPGSVRPDGVPGSLSTPPGHVSIVNVPPETLKNAVVPSPPTPPYGPGASGKFPK